MSPTSTTAAKKRPPFLTAQWVNLFLANFAVPDELLTRQLPPGLELDRWEGRAYVSVVAFEFRDTRVFGWRWPGYRRFPEVNLRYYVRQGPNRGVVFIREFVPKRLIAWIARWSYNEAYQVISMTNRTVETDETITVEHRLTWCGRDHILCATGRKPATTVPAGCLDHHLKELRLGYVSSRRGSLTVYEVEHPQWLVYPFVDYKFDLDWATLYGPKWGVLQGVEPQSVFLAAGSEIAVSPCGVCKPPSLQEFSSGSASPPIVEKPQEII